MNLFDAYIKILLFNLKLSAAFVIGGTIICMILYIILNHKKKK